MDYEGSEDEKGRLGHAIEFRYSLGTQSKVFNTSVGVIYSRLGFKREFQWTDATPEREERYGRFPITYKMWDDVHYISFPFYLNFNPGPEWHLSLSGSLDYPFGSGYFRRRSSVDEQVVETHSENFDSGKLYIWNTSIGSSFLVGRNFQLSEKIALIIEAQFKVYTILAARSNDYFPHKEYVRPYTIGISTGIKF